jgi:hypothetical protein
MIILIHLGELYETEPQGLVEIKSPSSGCRMKVLHLGSVTCKKNDRIAKGSVMILCRVVWQQTKCSWWNYVYLFFIELIFPVKYLKHRVGSWLRPWSIDCICGYSTLLNHLVTWLILPVVICLSQRLSHACLSINKFILWNCEWLIKSVMIYVTLFYYLDNRGNSRANTCKKTLTYEGVHLLDKANAG